MTLMDVCFVAHCGLKSDIVRGPKSANCCHWHGTYELVFLAPDYEETNA